jgi:hypothetical protein
MDNFFYNLNKKMADLAQRQDLAESAVAERDMGKHNNATTGFKALAKKAGGGEKGNRIAGAQFQKMKKAGQLEETDMDESALQAYIGDKKYGRDGMEALRKAGRDGASKDKMSSIRNKYNKMDEDDVEEGNKFAYNVLKAKAAGVKKADLDGDGDMETVREADKPMSPKQKSFAKLAPPADKITFADKIAGAKKEVDEMLGDVAAEAMRKAVVGHAGEEEMDEGYAEMDSWLKSREKEKGTGKFDKKERTLPSGMKATTYTRRHEDDKEDDSDAPVDKGGAPKKKGRPVGTRRAIGAKHSGRSKLASKDAIAEEGSTPQEQAYIEIIKLLKDPESKIDSSICNRLMRLVRTLNVSEPVAEKATSKAQQRFMGMVHSIQKGEKVKGASSELKKTAKGMKKKDAEDFAATKHKGLPEKVKTEEKTSTEDNRAEKAGKKVAKDIEHDEGHKGKDDRRAEKAGKKVAKDIEHDDKKDREEKVDETTVAGSVATAPAVAKSGKGMQFGKGVYESLDNKLEKMITEGMNVTVNMSTDEQGQAQKSITVTATDQDADKLAELLKMAGLGGQSNQDAPCSQCAEVVDENSPDWPTNTVTGGDDDPNLRTYSGGLNKPKSTGQTTIPVIASQLRRTSTMEENVELERSLFKTWKNYKG